MCLFNSPNSVKSFLKKRRGKTAIVYKVVKFNKDVNKLFPPMYLWGKQRMQYKLGWNAGDSRRNTASRKREDVGPGIHVCLTLAEAKYIANGQDNRKIMKVRVLNEDLLGVDYGMVRAVFKKIYISEQEYKKACK